MKKRRTIREYKEAILRHGGCLAEVAREFGYSYAGVYDRVHRHEELKRLVEKARETSKEELVDIAERQCFKLVSKGRWDAIKHVLSTHGAKRGWQEPPAALKVDGHISAEIIVDLVPVDLPIQPELSDGD